MSVLVSRQDLRFLLALRDVGQALVDEKTDLATWQGCLTGSGTSDPETLTIWEKRQLTSQAEIAQFFGRFLSHGMAQITDAAVVEKSDLMHLRNEADKMPISSDTKEGLLTTTEELLRGKKMSKSRMLKAFQEFKEGSSDIQAYTAKSADVLDRSITACRELRDITTQSLPGDEERSAREHSALEILFIRSGLTDIYTRGDLLKAEASSRMSQTISKE